ncbi:MAG: flagellin [Methanoregulaceae archaeon]|jgi:flagellin FlaB|nr:flagellin [Methanoregulaceae archaeon]
MVKYSWENNAFTGLEAALVLIAFVVVAAVFSYIMLGAGFFSTQKSQQVIQAGISQTSGNIAVKGEIYGIANNDTTSVEKIQFGIGPAIAGTAVDYSRLSLTWSTNNVTPVRLNYTPSSPVAGQWTVTSGNSGSPPASLITGDHIVTLLACPPGPSFPNDRFTLELFPESGAPTGISRTIPAVITRTNLLY